MKSTMTTLSAASLLLLGAVTLEAADTEALEQAEAAA